MREQTKNMLIGVFVIIAISLIISIVMFLKPSVGDNEKTLNVRFTNINKLKVGTQVLFSGKPVGEVVKIETVPHPREQPTDEMERFYFYQFTIHYDSSIKVYSTDKISIVTSGLLGEKSIEITPIAPPRGVIPKLVGDQPVYADSLDAFERIIVQFNAITSKLKNTLDEVNQWITTTGPLLTEAIDAFRATMNELETTAGSINEQQIVAHVKDVLINFSRISSQIQCMMNQLQNDQVFSNIGILTNKLVGVSEHIDTITGNIAKGKGSLGQLITGDDFYLRLMNIMGKVDTLMNDVNHYGVLFHLNKGWQRMRTQRMTLLDSLSSPKDFRQYFQQEVDQINTSMNRLSLLVEKAEEAPKQLEIFQAPCFKEDFATLMREVQELYKSLRLYNEQLNELQTCLPGCSDEAPAVCPN